MKSELKTEWIVVSHAAGARVFERHGQLADWTLIREYFHPEGKMTSDELSRKKSGVSLFRRGGPRHTFSRRRSPKRVSLTHFAELLGHDLEANAKRARFDALKLVCGPKFLGLLRAELGPNSRRRLNECITKDLGTIEKRRLSSYLNQRDKKAANRAKKSASRPRR